MSIDLDRPEWSGLGPNEVVVGETPPSPRGYYALVVLKTFVEPDGHGAMRNRGVRVRVYLLRTYNHRTVMLRHLDLTVELAEILWPLIRTAAAKGASQ